jgi:hypothetical protein
MSLGIPRRKSQVVISFVTPCPFHPSPSKKAIPSSQKNSNRAVCPIRLYLSSDASKQVYVRPNLYAFHPFCLSYAPTFHWVPGSAGLNPSHPYHQPPRWGVTAPLPVTLVVPLPIAKLWSIFMTQSILSRSLRAANSQVLSVP